MNYPKSNLITVLLILLGTHPIHEDRKSNWLQKVHRIGFIFLVAQIILTPCTFAIEQAEEAFGSGNSNNIVNGFVTLKRIFAFFLPILTIIIKLFTIRLMEELIERIQLFDVFLKSTVHSVSAEFRLLQEQIEQKIRKLSFVGGLFVILVVLFNLVTALLYMIFIRGIFPSVSTFYFYHSAITIFITTSLDVYTKLYGLMLRHELLNQFVRDIWEKEWAEESGRRKQRRVVLRELLKQGG